MNDESNVLPVVCLAVGDSLPDFYIERLYEMLVRHTRGRKVKLLCYSDRKRQLSAGIEQFDCSDWNEVKREGMRVTTQKIRFFDGVTVPYDEFLYLDLTLVIRDDLSRLLEFANSKTEPLVIVKDWDYDSFNSCVMRIRPRELRFIYDAFVTGESFPQRIKGDQEFITRCIESKSMLHLAATFPAAEIASYKGARNLNRTDPTAAKRMIEVASIIKFHGRPKPHDLLNPFYNFFKVRIKHPKDASFWIKGLRENWK